MNKLSQRITNAVKSSWSALSSNEGEISTIIYSPDDVLKFCESHRLSQVGNCDLASKWAFEIKDIVRDLEELNVANPTLERGIQLFESLEPIQIGNLYPTPRNARVFVIACVLLADIQHRPLPLVEKLAEHLLTRGELFRFHNEMWARTLIFFDSWMQLPKLCDFVRVGDRKIIAQKCMVLYRASRLPIFDPSLNEPTLSVQLRGSSTSKSPSTNALLSKPLRNMPSAAVQSARNDYQSFSISPPKSRVGQHTGSVLQHRQSGGNRPIHHSSENEFPRPPQQMSSSPVVEPEYEPLDLITDEYSSVYSPIPKHTKYHDGSDMSLGKPSGRALPFRCAPTITEMKEQRPWLDESQHSVSRHHSSKAYPSVADKKLQASRISSKGSRQYDKSHAPTKYTTHSYTNVDGTESRGGIILSDENDTRNFASAFVLPPPETTESSPAEVTSSEGLMKPSIGRVETGHQDEEPRKRRRISSYKPKDTRTPRFSLHGDMPNPFVPDISTEEQDRSLEESANPFERKPVPESQRPKSWKPATPASSKPKKRVSFADDEGLQLEDVRELETDYDEYSHDGYDYDDDTSDSDYEDYTDSDWVSTDDDFDSEDSEELNFMGYESDGHTIDYEDETDTTGLRTDGTSTEYTTEYTATTGYSTDGPHADEYESDSSLPLVKMDEKEGEDDGTSSSNYEIVHSEGTDETEEDSTKRFELLSGEVPDTIMSDQEHEHAEGDENMASLEREEDVDGNRDEEEGNAEESSDENANLPEETIGTNTTVAPEKPVRKPPTIRPAKNIKVPVATAKPSRRLASMQRRGGVPHRSPRAAGLRVSPRGFKSASSTWAAPGTPFDILIGSAVAIAAPHLSKDGTEQYDQSLRAALTVAAGGDIESGVQDALVLAPTTMSEEEEKKLEEAVRAAAKEAAQSAPPSLSSRGPPGTEAPSKGMDKEKTTKKPAARPKNSKKVEEPQAKKVDAEPLKKDQKEAPTKEAPSSKKGPPKPTTKKATASTTQSKGVSFAVGTKPGKSSERKPGVGPARRNSKVVEAKRNSGKPGPAKRVATKQKRRGMVARIAELKSMADEAEKSKAPPSARALRAARRNGEIL